MTEVNGFRSHYFQFLATTYSSVTITNERLDGSAVIWSGDCWDGQFGLLKRIDSSVMNWSNNLWCRQYTNGFNWVGGKVSGSLKDTTVTFPVSFENLNYTLIASSPAVISNKTTTSFTVNSTSNRDTEFMAYGY